MPWAQNSKISGLSLYRPIIYRTLQKPKTINPYRPHMVSSQNGHMRAYRRIYGLLSIKFLRSPIPLTMDAVWATRADTLDDIARRLMAMQAPKDSQLHNFGASRCLDISPACQHLRPLWRSSYSLDSSSSPQSLRTSPGTCLSTLRALLASLGWLMLEGGMRCAMTSAMTQKLSQVNTNVPT